jgi:hypothetical protein
MMKFLLNPLTSSEKRGMKASTLFLALFLLEILAGCASPSGRELLEQRQAQNKSRYAGYAADGFTLDDRLPEERPEKTWQFYYKQCELVTRNPYPDRDEYSCTDPW